MDAKYIQVAAGIALVAVIAALAVNQGASAGVTTSTTTAVTTINYSAPGTFNAMQQQAKAQGNGLYLPMGYFSCSYNSDCIRVPIAVCDNGLPSQSACINKGYYAAYSAEYNSTIGQHREPCPLYIINENVSCSCEQSTNTCLESYGPG